MSYNTIIVEKSEDIEIITLNRPHTLNAWDQQMGLEVTEALNDIRGDSGVKVVILTGSGRGFSSGADMGSLSNIDGPVKSPFAVIPDLIRDPEVFDITGFRLSPE